MIPKLLVSTNSLFLYTLSVIILKSLKSYSSCFIFSVSDTERKYFEFSSKANIVCTFMGLADDWDGMYQYVKEKVRAPKLVVNNLI